MKIRCYAKRVKGLWIAMSIDSPVVVSSPFFADAKRKMKDSDHEPHSADLSDFVKYYLTLIGFIKGKCFTLVNVQGTWTELL